MDATSKLKDLALSDSGFVFDPYSGATFSTNAVGLTILRALKDGLGRDHVVAAIREGFETASADVERDLDEFLHLLRKHNVVPKDYRP